MNRFQLSHLSHAALLENLHRLVARDRDTTAWLVAHIAEVETRKLHLGDAYPSMFACCVGHLGLSEPAAYKRIRVARLAKRFPVILDLLADGRLNLSTVILLRGVLRRENARELLAAAAGKTRAEVERMLAERFPRLPVPAQVEPIRPEGPGLPLSPGTVGATPGHLGCRRCLPIGSRCRSRSTARPTTGSAMRRPCSATSWRPGTWPG